MRSDSLHPKKKKKRKEITPQKPLSVFRIRKTRQQFTLWQRRGASRISGRVAFRPGSSLQILIAARIFTIPLTREKYLVYFSRSSPSPSFEKDSTTEIRNRRGKYKKKWISKIREKRRTRRRRRRSENNRRKEKYISEEERPKQGGGGE